MSNQLIEAQRYEIYLGLKRKWSRSRIAEEIGVSKSTVNSAWQKGAIENANKLIRKYIPKKANFQDFSDWKIKEIQKKLNRRPREKLNFDSPKYRFFINVL